MLSQHPNVLHKLREEILSVVGNSINPTRENLREMKYLKAVINGTSRRVFLPHHRLMDHEETLRLYPPV